MTTGRRIQSSESRVATEPRIAPRATKRVIFAAADEAKSLKAATVVAYDTALQGWVEWEPGGANGRGQPRGIVYPVPVTVRTDGEAIGVVMIRGAIHRQDLVADQGTTQQLLDALSGTDGSAPIVGLGIQISGYQGQGSSPPMPLAPAAAFTATPTSGKEPLEVQFTDTSINQVTSWLWDFGDGNTSKSQHPQHTYAADGTYTVELTVMGPGGTDTLTATDLITVFDTTPVPVADFSASPLGGAAPLNVTFADLSTGTVTSWLWDFGDGNSSTAQNPVHQYTDADVYDVTLTVVGPGGMDTRIRAGYISVGAAGSPPYNPDPEPVVWRIPSEYDEILASARPRGPGPVNGPLPNSGDYMTSRLAAHVAVADAWDPNETPFDWTQWGWKGCELAIAWVGTGDPAYVAKADAMLARWAAGTIPANTWTWLAAGFIADHMWASLDVSTRDAAQAAILGTLDAKRTDPGTTYTGWNELDWEAWTAASGGHGFMWALVAFAEDNASWRPLWDWFGEVWFLRYTPFHWLKCSGPDGASWPNQGYLASNVGAYLYPMHLLMAIATGLDTFDSIINGGYVGPMIEMAWQRRLPTGHDINEGAQTNSFYGPSNLYNLPGFPLAAAFAYQSNHPVASRLAWLDGFTDPTTRLALPWSCFPPAIEPSAGTKALEWRCASFGVARDVHDDEDAAVLNWRRGEYLIGHHRAVRPGHFTLFGGGARLVGNPDHYGFGFQAEFVHRFPKFNGMRFWSDDDTADQETYFFFTTVGGSLVQLAYTNDGGPNLTGQNPYNFRPAAGHPFPRDPWQGFNDRRSAFRDNRPIGHGPGWEATDWAPSYTDWDKGTWPLFRPGINSRPTRVERWVRVLVWDMAAGWLVVLDDNRPLGNVTQTAWDLHLHGIPTTPEAGLWHLQRHGTIENAEVGAHWQLPHAAPPFARRNGNLYTMDADLWIRQLAGGGTWESGQTPLAGIRQWPHPGQAAMDDGRFPDDWASWRLRLVDPGSVVVNVFSLGASELASSFMDGETWRLNVGAASITIDKASYAVTIA